jgi:hypothetical protein
MPLNKMLLVALNKSGVIMLGDNTGSGCGGGEMDSGRKDRCRRQRSHLLET